MIKTVMVGSVSVTRPAEVFVAKPMHIPKFDELALLAHQVSVYLDYAENVSSTRTANNAWVVVVRLKKYMDRMYKRWNMEG